MHNIACWDSLLIFSVNIGWKFLTKHKIKILLGIYFHLLIHKQIWKGKLFILHTSNRWSRTEFKDDQITQNNHIFIPRFIRIVPLEVVSLREGKPKIFIFYWKIFQNPGTRRKPCSSPSDIIMLLLLRTHFQFVILIVYSAHYMKMWVEYWKKTTKKRVFTMIIDSSFL